MLVLKVVPGSPKCLEAFDDAVLVEHHQFAVRGDLSSLPLELPAPGEFLWAGSGGALLLSGGTDHYANVRLELWSAVPPLETSQAWDDPEEGVLVADGSDLVIEGATGAISDSTLPLPTSGSYGIRAYCRGRKEAQEATLDDDEFPAGLESWRIQLWPLAGIEEA